LICNLYNCTQDLPSTLFCETHNSWSEVNEELTSLNCASNPPEEIYLQLLEPIPFTSDFNISDPTLQSADELFLYGVSGVNVYPWPALVVSASFIKKVLFLDFSIVEFYVNNTPPSGYTCSHDLIPDDSAKKTTLLSTYLNGFYIYYGNKYGSSSSQSTICSQLFKNAQLAQIQLEYQVKLTAFCLSVCLDSKTTAVG
jgi:hypothetical protein